MGGDVSSIFLDEVGRRLGREGGDDEGRALQGFCYVCGGLQAFGQLDVRQVARVAPRGSNSSGLLWVPAVPPYAMTLAGRQKGHRRPEVAAAEDTNFLWLLFRVVVDVLLEGGARRGLGRHLCVDGVLARSGPTAVLRKRRLSTLDFRCLRRVYIYSTRPAAFLRWRSVHRLISSADDLVLLALVSYRPLE